MQENQKEDRNRFTIKPPDGYKPNRAEMSNALYLLGNFGFHSTDTDWLLDEFDEGVNVEDFLHRCCERLSVDHGPARERVYEMISSWFQHTTQEDRTHAWQRPVQD